MWKWSAVQVVGRLGLFGGMAMFTFKSCQYCCEPLTTKECPGVEKRLYFQASNACWNSCGCSSCRNNSGSFGRVRLFQKTLGSPERKCAGRSRKAIFAVNIVAFAAHFPRCSLAVFDSYGPGLGSIGEICPTRMSR